MSSREKITEFRSRWNFKLDDASELARFRNRTATAVESLFHHYLRYSPRAYHKLSVILGYPYKERDPRVWEYRYFEIGGVVKAAKSVPALLEILQALLWMIEEFNPSDLKAGVALVKQVLEASPYEIDIVGVGNGFALYPAGAKSLDQALIDDNLHWLTDYPEVLKHYQKALKLFLTKDPTVFRNALDNLRFCLEQLLKHVLKNEKSLENQKEPLLKWLASKGLHGNIVNMYKDLVFEGFAKYQNDAVKHAERYEPQEIEFMIYITGAFLRLVLQVAKS